MSDNPLRRLPAVNDVLAQPALAAARGAHGHGQVVAAVRAELADLRATLAQGGAGEADAEAVAGRAAGRLGRSLRPKLVPVINATGIVLHTNLGRAPLAEE